MAKIFAILLDSLGDTGLVFVWTEYAFLWICRSAHVATIKLIFGMIIICVINLLMENYLYDIH